MLFVCPLPSDKLIITHRSGRLELSIQVDEKGRKGSIIMGLDETEKQLDMALDDIAAERKQQQQQLEAAGKLKTSCVGSS